MSYSKSGLSKYNPLYILSNSVSEVPFRYNLLTFTLVQQHNLFEYDIKAFLDERDALCALYCEYVQTNLNYSELFHNKFQELLNSLKFDTSEKFWDDLHILFEIFYRVSAVSVCRKLIMEYLTDILQILNKALQLEKELQPKTKDYDVLSLQVASLFIKNKFSTNSEIDDDELIDYILGHMPAEQHTISNMITLSELRNCDKFMLSAKDIIYLFLYCKEGKLDYFWIYSLYIKRYKDELENLLINTVGDSLYHAWFENLISFRVQKSCKDGTLDKLYSNVCEEISIFNSHGVYTFDSNLILKMIKEKRDDYGISGRS